MSFVKKVVGPDEKLIGISSIHWIYGIQGLMWLLGFLALGVFIDQNVTRLANNFPGNPGAISLNLISDYALWICMAIGVIFFLMYFTTMISAEIGLTTKRVIYKKGLFLVDVRQIDIEEIKSADVNNGWFGRFLNYGYVALDARFVNNVELPALDDPYRFTKALNELRTRQRGDTMKIVLEGASDNVQVQTAGGEAIPVQQPLRSLTDRRYKALDSDPVEAVGEVVGEAVQTAGRTSEGAPVKKRKRTRGPKLAHERRDAAKARQADEQNNRVLGKGPIVFKQAQLKREIKEDFTGQSGSA
jgi:hypothetical protein